MEFMRLPVGLRLEELAVDGDCHLQSKYVLT